MNKINPNLRALIRPIADLKLHDKNTRKHDERNLAAVGASLDNFEQQKPIVVASDGVVIAGNGTLQAAVRLGWTEIAAVLMDVPSTDPKARGFAIADNRSADLSTFDRDMLLQEIDGLRETTDLSLLGFSGGDIDALQRSGSIELFDYENAKVAAREFVKRDLLDPRHAVADGIKDDPPPQFVRRVTHGDIWQIGRHRLICGDSLDDANLAELFGNEKAALVSTDPPYLVNYTGERPGYLSARPVTNAANDPHFGSGKNWGTKYNEVETGDAATFYSRLFAAARKVVVDDSAYYVWHADVRSVELIVAARDAGLLVRQFLVWVKPTVTLGRKFWQYRHEPCVMAWVRGNKPRMFPGDNETTIWQIDWEGSSRVVGNFHPTQKPVELFCKPMRMHTLEGDLCFEPFCGSGSQIIAGELLKRRVFACELSPHFCDGILDRWERFVGNGAKAEKVGHVDQTGKAQPVGPSVDRDEEMDGAAVAE